MSKGKPVEEGSSQPDPARARAIAWQSLRNALQAQLLPEQFDVWFSRAVLRQIDDECVRFAVESSSTREWITAHYMDVIEKTVRKMFGPRRVDIEVDPDLLSDLPAGASTTVTKKEFVNQIAEQTGQTKVVVKDILQRFLDEILFDISQGNRIEFRQFGVFEVRLRAARRARSPRVTEVPAKRVVKFRVGRSMRRRVEEVKAPESSVPVPRRFAQRIADATGQPTVMIGDVLQRFLESIIEKLSRGHRVEFREFGTFEVRERAARRAQNPRTHEVVDVPRRRAVKFKVGRLMRELVDAAPIPSEVAPAEQEKHLLQRSESEERSPPVIALVWDAEHVSQSLYKQVVEALGDMALMHGAKGIERVRKQFAGIPVRQVVND